MSDSKIKSYLDYFENDYPVCPYCDHVNEDTNVFYPQNHCEFSTGCENCGKDFYCTVEAKYTYTTNGNCNVHKLYKSVMSSSYTCQICASEFFGWDLNGGKFEKLKESQYEIIESIK